MIDYFFFIFCFLSILNLRVKGFDDFFNDYMKLDNTSSIKGIFVWLIIFCHKIKYGINKNYLFKKIVRNLGQKVVSMFLFYSGFGIYESIKTKGSIYVKTLPYKAVIIFLKSQIIILMFLGTNIFIFKKKISLKIYFLSVIFKSSLGNSNWFAFTIIILYFYSYLSFRFIKNKIFIGIIIITFFCYLHTRLVYNYYYPKAIYSVDTVFCFVIGFYYSLIKKYLDKIITKNDIYYFGFTSCIIFIYSKIFIIDKVINISIKNVLFALLVVLISIKVQFNNVFLKFLNSHSYSIYLLQRLVMWIVYRKRIFKNNNFIQISFEFTSIFFIASLFDKYTILIDLFFKRNKTTLKNDKYIFVKNINIQSVKTFSS